jgi:galactose mutarotase-like enzyme
VHRPSGDVHTRAFPRAARCTPTRSANWLSKTAGDAPFTQHRALCLETQNYPDAINQEAAGFPSAVLRPGQKYVATSVHKFSW